ncbi:MAG: MerR family transcriptional regulator [Sphingomonadaceae bacterium]
MKKPSSETVPPIQPDASQGAYRSGVAARLAGLPVETLRVWERRYGISAPHRSAHGQRLYTAEQVQRLALLKRVVDQGHPIGTVATLTSARLLELAGAAPGKLAALDDGRRYTVALVGDVLGRRIEGEAATAALEIVRSCSALGGAAKAFAGAHTELLLVEVPELSSHAIPLITAARDAVAARAVVVMYRFCDSATIRMLRSHGCLVARAPSEAGEVMTLCRTALASALTGLPPAAVTEPIFENSGVPPRRLDDHALALLTTTPNNINCECPRHLADILLMLGSFERYSAQCAARNDEDAALHRELGISAGQARVIMEASLERLARLEGLPLPPGLG